MRLTEIRRYPVKSMLGELLPTAEAGDRGLTGDRLWAVRDPDGKFGSGKNTRRFRRIPGLFDLRATGDDIATVHLPDARAFRADDPDGYRALSSLLGRPVTLTPESTIPHHDEGPISLITTAALRDLTSICGADPGHDTIDPQRFRANLLIDTPALPGPAWAGRRLRIGEVILRIVRPLTRCAMIDMAQATAPTRNDLLKTLATTNDLTFGVLATVEHGGRLTSGDACGWLPPSP
ncbi:MOSC domain-containing protein [Actinoplanes solisilvae]|uniref:MOSC domain-containing protein n=1 Tax=Actinoplanes solisilvae TaxID=2486853 RepID=UPI000FDB7B2E|nr:MOSC N-terminal beta barrel domain-containing protein [Actinoplanes solisilvae]